ncbi:glycosyltransferase family 25 protein [Celeribacter baekdonensis]|uniref:glycosyltransferase family 25 protein n=1 Tax=Celeribacter baekdonensis TaxID=875171 RepID=UPI0030D73809|tara:strand:+ start:25355 stop:26167 length:813 start_codon:yes stop_codon:yes gene_type:complete
MTAQCYFINMATAHDRCTHMRTMLDRLGLPHKQHLATTPDTLADTCARLGITVVPDTLSINEQACAISHIALWDRIATGQDDWALVLEDDVYLSADARDGIEFAIAQSGCGLIRVEHWQQARIQVSKRRICDDAGRFALHVYYDDALGTAAYLLHRDGAKALLSQVKTLSKPMDYILFNAATPPQIDIQILSPAVAIQSDKLTPALKDPRSPWSHISAPFDSSVQGPQTDRKKTLKAKLRQEYHNTAREIRAWRKGRKYMVVPMSDAGPL